MWLPQGGALKIENLQFTQYTVQYHNVNAISVTAELQLTIMLELLN